MFFYQRRNQHGFYAKVAVVKCGITPKCRKIHPRQLGYRRRWTVVPDPGNNSGLKLESGSVLVHALKGVVRK